MPAQLMVPASITDTDVASVAEFRSKGRLPICSWVHSTNTASIWRCAQPKRGIFNAQNAADTRYLATIAQSNVRQPRMWIADCRPELNTRANNLTRGGTESSSLLHARVTFLNIANIHAMRESLKCVRNLVHSVNSELDFSWSARVEDTKWLMHIRLVLSAAFQVADAVENQQTTVLVHCSDGWDRTAQLCALSQLLLDRHYRTILGFIQLIEKEWIRAGHKFNDRIGPGKPETDDQSPIFVQFLDCVWQLWRLL
jgi:Myotubularin-like phosphatase domain